MKPIFAYVENILVLSCGWLV